MIIGAHHFHGVFYKGILHHCIVENGSSATGSSRLPTMWSTISLYHPAVHPYYSHLKNVDVGYRSSSASFTSSSYLEVNYSCCALLQIMFDKVTSDILALRRSVNVCNYIIILSFKSLAATVFIPRILISLQLKNKNC